MMRNAALLLVFVAGCDRYESVAERSHAVEARDPAEDEVVEVEPEPGAAVAWRVPIRTEGDEPTIDKELGLDIPAAAVAGIDMDGDGASEDLDCDDLDPAVGPLAREVRCDGMDQNCNGTDNCDQDGDGVVDHEDVAPRDPLIGGVPEAVAPLGFD